MEHFISDHFIHQWDGERVKPERRPRDDHFTPETPRSCITKYPHHNDIISIHVCIYLGRRRRWRREIRLLGRRSTTSLRRYRRHRLPAVTASRRRSDTYLDCLYCQCVVIIIIILSLLYY